MARIRTIKPEFWRDEDLSSVSAEAALLAIGLLNHADDEGFFSANYKLVESDVFPLRKLSSSVHELLHELSVIGYVSLHEGSDKRLYGQVANFKKHQVISRPTPSKIKELVCFLDDSVIDTGALRDCSMSAPAQLIVGKEGKGKEKEWNGSGSAETEFKVSISWRPSDDSMELIKLARGRLPDQSVINAHLANFVGYWRTRDTARRQDQWDHSFADWVNQNRNKEQQIAISNPEQIYINVLGQQIDTSQKIWDEWFRDNNDADTPEALRIDKAATRAARKQAAQ